MHLRYDDDFLEAAVFMAASGRRAGVPPLQIRRFHAERERCYTIIDPEEREAAFFRLHLEWFREWGLERLLDAILKEFPSLPDALDGLAWRKARVKNDEGAELYVQTGAGVSPASVDRSCDREVAGTNSTGRMTTSPPWTDPSGPLKAGPRPYGRSYGEHVRSPLPLSRTGVVAMRVERLANDDEVRQFLRHEFMHVHDMLDPAFAYSRDLVSRGPSSAPPRLVRERYRILWDITIDGRLSRRGHALNLSRERHQALFDRAFSFWAETKRRETFDELWLRGAPTHELLLNLASDPRDLTHAREPQPGGLCPLCGFPTFDWVECARLSPSTREAITRQFADWTPAQGACKRCIEMYEIAGRVEIPPTMCV
jgi:hypothetical protein